MDLIASRVNHPLSSNRKKERFLRTTKRRRNGFRKSGNVVVVVYYCFSFNTSFDINWDGSGMREKEKIPPPCVHFVCLMIIRTAPRLN